ncbi:hypothetical protein [Pseudomonas aeruginosa]|nr:hypothetical protein [Pseudomonas aeruginosa]
MTRAADENKILDSLGRIISTHADWMAALSSVSASRLPARTSKSKIWTM